MDGLTLNSTMSLPTHRMLQNPRLTRHLVAKKAFVQQPLVVVDAGAKGGFETQWDFYGDEQVQLIGFEPNVAECERLNAGESRPNRRYYPTALHRTKGAKTLHINAHEASSSFLKPDFEFLKRTPDWTSLVAKKNIRVRTDSLDSFARSRKIGNADFIKIDTEGSELPILEGAKATLPSVLGLSVEVSFHPQFQNQPVFADIDAFLRLFGFWLFDLTTFKVMRSELSPYRGAKFSGPTYEGQIFLGQALYLRDAVWEFQNGKGTLWNTNRLLKLASIMEIFSLQDCAMEMIRVGMEKGYFTDSQQRTMMELLVPEVHGKRYTYRVYMKYARENLRRKLKPKK